MSQRVGFWVPPMKKIEIAATARSVRQSLQRVVGTSPYVPIDQIYEVLPAVLDGFDWESCDKELMGANHGLTDPDNLHIQLRVDVYDGMCQGRGRDRFTAAHELGHLFLHQGTAKFARSLAANEPLYCNSEWQADIFASHFLIEESELPQCRTVDDVQQRFGVTRAAAEARFQPGRTFK